MDKRRIDLSGKTGWVTGAAGFFGAALCRRLLSDGAAVRVIGIDNMNDYYDVRLKEARLGELTGHQAFTFIRGDIADRAAVEDVFARYRPQIVVNLAAQAGVRYSITNPDAYIQSNIVGFHNILEACRRSHDGGNNGASGADRSAGTAGVCGATATGGSAVTAGAIGAGGTGSAAGEPGEKGSAGVEHLVYASSSSVYGSNAKIPYSTDDRTDSPVSLYAATKKSNELLAHAYSKLYDIPSTGLRFFTVYGPVGRPDMAYYSFTERLAAGGKIRIFNYGDCRRDFTYVDDIVEGVVRVMGGAPDRDSGPDGLPLAPHAVYNIGGGRPESLLDFVAVLQEELVAAGILPADYDFEAHRELVPMQPGDVPVTYADTTALERDYGYRPSTTLREGLRRFARWYAESAAAGNPH